MFLTLLISALLAGFTPTGEPVAGAPAGEVITAPADSVLVLPEDRKAQGAYNGHFDHSTQVMKGNPNLQKVEQEQNIAGGRLSEYTLYFRRNKTNIDPDYLWNRSQEEDVCAILSRRNLPDSVVIYAWASPEGHYEHNVWLSQKRAEAARDFVLAHSSLDPSRIVISHQEENWPGLRQAVRQFYDQENKDTVLDILTRPGLSDQEREQALKALDEGKTFNYLLETLMKPLRSAVIVFHYARQQIAPAALECGLLTFPEPESRPAARPEVTPVVVQPQEDEQEIEPAAEPEYAKRTIVALKTNALYDLALAPNYAIEVPIGKHFSAQWEHYFPWWATTKELKYCLQYLTLGGEFRWWFARKPKPETPSRMLRDVLQGHFVGVYGLWGKTDIQWERKLGMYQCYPVWSAGLTYGYSFALTKHWNMELSVSAGYARIPYQHYTPSEDWQILWRDRSKEGVLHYFGPTQVKVSLVRPIVIRYRVK